MSAEYQLRIYNRAGTLQAVVVDFLRLAYRHQRNAPGLLEFSISPEHRAVSALELDGSVEVWRRVSGGAWYVDFIGLYRWRAEGLDGDGRAWLTVRCVGLLHLLSRCIVAYPKGVASRSLFTAAKAETILKTLVTHNCTAAGTTNDGRLRAASLAGVQVESDAARGDAIDFECSLQNVLAACQRVANLGGGDFVFVKAAAATWEFRWKAANSTTVVFAPNLGNMASPTLTRDWTDEATVAIAGGNNLFGVAEGDAYASGYRSHELYVGAPNLTTIDGLVAAGDAALLARRTEELAFSVFQTPWCRYGVEYQFLDFVTATFGDYSATMQIQEVGVGVQEDGAETIQVVCRE